MHLFKFAFYCTGALYALFVERALLLYFVLIVAAYFILSAVWPGAKSLSTRKKIMLGTWSEPGEGIITTRVAVRVEKVLELLETIPK